MLRLAVPPASPLSALDDLPSMLRLTASLASPPQPASTRAAKAKGKGKRLDTLMSSSTASAAWITLAMTHYRQERIRAKAERNSVIVKEERGRKKRPSARVATV